MVSNRGVQEQQNQEPPPGSSRSLAGLLTPWRQGGVDGPPPAWVTRTHQQLSLEIIYEVTNSTLALGASLSLVAWGFIGRNWVSKRYGVYLANRRARAALTCLECGACRDWTR
jgi:hypothetical protein